MTRIWLILLLLGLIILVSAALFLLAWLEKKLRRRSFRVELVNTGNAQSRYALYMDDPSGLLRSEFRLNGALLPQRSESVAVVKVGEPTPMGMTAAPAPAPTPYNPRSSQGGALNLGITIAGLFTGLFSTLGALLPGELGSVFYRLSSQASQAETQAQRVQSLGQQSAYLKDTVTTQPAQQDYAQPQAPTAPVAPTTMAVTRLWSETPYIKAGDTVTVDLLITPVKRLTTMHAFTVVSKTAEQADVPALTEQGSIAGGSFLSAVWPWLLLVGGLFIVVLVVMLGMTLAGRFP
jgi:hypothetical protein